MCCPLPMCMKPSLKPSKHCTTSPNVKIPQLHRNTNIQYPVFCKRSSLFYDCSNRNPQFAIWRDVFFTTGQTVFFFQSLGEKNKKQKFVTRNPGDTMGVSGYGSFFCLWAICTRSARGSVFIEPWAMPSTAGAMKIERGVVYNPTIHHPPWLLVRKNVILGAASHGLYRHL
jgi:hypothetical protein